MGGKIRMATSLTAFERETTINWNEQDNYATIDTRSGRVIYFLEDKLGIKPVKVRESINTGELLGKLYHVPVKWVKLPRPPTKKNLSDEQRQKIGERFKAIKTSGK